MKPSLKMIQKKNALQDGLYPIYLRITINRKSKFYATSYKCKKSEWNDRKGEFNSSFPNNLTFNKALRKILDTSVDIIEDIKIKHKKVTLIQFDNYYRSLYKSEMSFLDYLDYQIKSQKEAGQLSYAGSHKSTRISLLKFEPNLRDYSFEDIDYTFLTEFETFLRKEGGNDSGIGVYMRNIRAVYNKAIKAKIVSIENYPFNDYKISRLRKKKKKRALECYDLQKLMNCDIDQYPKAKNAVYAYLFSYYARGMNFTDMATLKWDDLANNTFEYTRNKTGVHLKVKLPDVPKMNEILDYFRRYRPFDTNYIFPILKKDESLYELEELKNRKDSVRSYYNKQLKRIAKIVGLTENITFYNARHTYATNAVRKNMNLIVLKQSLGHQNVSTTENYIQDFKNDDLNDIINDLF